MSEPGFLEVNVEAHSQFLNNSLPFVVRDAHHSLVQEGTVGAGSRTALPEGLYTVAMLTPGGEHATEVVHIRPDMVTPVIFTDQVLDDLFIDVAPEVQEADAEGVAEGPSRLAVDTNTAVELLSWERCTVTRQSPTGWEFAPVDPLDAVPTAVFGVEDRHWEISLPLNPAGTDPGLMTCQVLAATEKGRTRVRAQFGPRRRVSRMVGGAVGNNAMASGVDVIGFASELLFYKYADPPGAVLGALTLHRMGRLQERQRWVENLSRHFPWLPDSQVLCAALLQKDEKEAARHRGLELLLAATTSRPMYTDGLSLAMELLRHWPDAPSGGVRQHRLESLAGLSSYADWDSVTLCVDVTEER